MGIFDMGKSISDTVGKITDKITSDKDRAEEANKALENAKEVDLAQINAGNNFNARNLRYWVELICVIGFFYSYLVVPFLNDFFKLSLHGIADQSTLDSLLYAMFGLGGYRIAEKVIKK